VAVAFDVGERVEVEDQCAKRIHIGADG